MSSLPSGVPFMPIAAVNSSSLNSTSQTLPSATFTAPSPTPNTSHSFFVAPPVTSCPVTPPNNPLPNSSNLSAVSKASLDVLIDKEQAASSLSHWSNVPRPLPFDLNEDAPVITPDSTILPVLSFIDDLSDSGFHVPLSLFSYESLYKLQNQPLAIKTIKVHCKGQTVYILDISQFPSKTNMLPLDWLSAWE
ncbi:hypothetical protein EDD16DRAFT_1892117 [Pisolithus croceorrhizus]|nr:hypothetical protein EDD16DRAFT_1892117 [Pisolithus croceorrhizus]KAI6129952.1 hypothetical protein EV401DRAFT_2206066 [Pisolithus croceorrhizus]KAI6166568.1 hypothetical protein EDD17DRAFT_1854571 [Pisolithus thermaeus]